LDFAVNRFGRRALLTWLALAPSAQALGRTPRGGVLSLSVPYGLRELDPHVLDDPVAALFAPAIADPLYALDAAGRPYAALAMGLPEPGERGAVVRLRPGLRSAQGKPLDARDVVFSLERAKKLGAAGLLAPFGAPKVRPDRESIEFEGTRPDDPALPLALASPLTALVPRGFSKLAPDGTGAFAAVLSRDGLKLSRNPRAARGASFLERIEVSSAPDLAEALRAFEAGLTDVGWLGAGLHRARPGAKSFVGPVYGHLILRSGKEAGAWGSAGLAQQLADGARPEQLGHLGVAPEPGAGPGIAWGGGAVELLVASESAQLRAIAQALAAALSRPGNPVKDHPLPRAEFELRRSERRFALMLDFVRPLGTTQDALSLALLTAENPALARRPPRLAGQTVRDLTRTLSLGAIGRLRLVGAVLPDVRALEQWQLGAVWRERVRA
jgi:peptide/nickel transport system substrate-binding protein